MHLVDQVFVFLIHEMHLEHQVLSAVNSRENFTEISKILGAKLCQRVWPNLSFFTSSPDHVDLVFPHFWVFLNIIQKFFRRFTAEIFQQITNLPNHVDKLLHQFFDISMTFSRRFTAENF